MKTTTSLLLSAVILSAFWAYEVIDDLIRKFSDNVTYIDLIVIFVLGLIAGITLGTAGVLSWKPRMN